MTEEQVRALVRQRSRRFSKQRQGSTGVTAWGRHHCVSRSHLSEFMAGKRSPTTDVLGALGLEYRIVRKRAALARRDPETDGQASPKPMEAGDE